jgi:FtsZ-interacting cell division protein ZipA
LAAELRWILLGLSALLLGGIWWWGARRSRQAPGNAELRESSADGAASHEIAAAYRPKDAEPRDWGVPPFEPLSIRTADFDEVHVPDVPMTATPAPAEGTLDLGSAKHEEAAEPADAFEASVAAERSAAAEPFAAIEPATEDEPPPMATSSAAGRPPGKPVRAADPAMDAPAPSAPPADPAPGKSAATAAAAPAQAPNVAETQRIVTVRVCASGELRWAGTDLMAALDAHGLAYGRYKVFHRKHSDGRTLFCAASLVEPGTFDIAKMPGDEFRGLTLFAVLPGPADAVQTIDALIATAVELADALQGVVQDSKGAPLTAQRAEALREDVARFQALLTLS